MIDNSLNWGLSADAHAHLVAGGDLDGMPWTDDLHGDVFRKWAKAEDASAEPLLDLQVVYDSFQRSPTAQGLTDIADCIDAYMALGGEEYDLTHLRAACATCEEAGALDDVNWDLIGLTTPMGSYFHRTWHIPYQTFNKRVLDYRARWADQDAEGLLLTPDGRLLDGEYPWSSDDSGLLYVFTDEDASTTLATMRHGSISTASSGRIQVTAGVPGAPVTVAAAAADAGSDPDGDAQVRLYDRETMENLDGSYLWSSDESGLLHVFSEHDHSRTLATMRHASISGASRGTITITDGVPGTPNEKSTLAAYDLEAARQQSVDAFDAMVAADASTEDRRVPFISAKDRTLIGEVSRDFGAIRALTEIGGVCQGFVEFERHRTSPNVFTIEVTEGSSARNVEGWLKVRVLSEEHYPYRDRSRVVYRYA